MHPQPEVFQAKLAEVFARDGERIEIVFVQIFAELTPPFLVLAPGEPDGEEKQRYNDRSNDVDRKLALQGVDHIAKYFVCRCSHRPTAVFWSVP